MLVCMRSSLPPADVSGEIEFNLGGRVFWHAGASRCHELVQAVISAIEWAHGEFRCFDSETTALTLELKSEVLRMAKVGLRGGKA